MTSAAEVDHLVIAAHTLEQGVAWCEATLGATPAAGGKHVHMGTHNRLLAISGSGFARCYLEIIAIDPDAPTPSRARWFGLDDAALQASLRERPRLMHVVARCSGLDAKLAALAAAGIDAGRAVTAERASVHGLLRWRIAGRDDGRLLFGGALPTLIEWGDMHPSEHLPASPAALAALRLGGLPAAARSALGLGGVMFDDNAPALRAEFDTPRGRVTLRSDA